ncbi:hypothetical protein D8674_025771 [Pyrus ussuriensis x Pyrus communis]|uniref:Uncharacterized protein n=1 Tax=Pyrus ussuriensis x Pyrus communis TaxID=2448454 RepID=A0A5N5I7Q2_9ROSA|nr:hypothetical protein D8674_025771 [Pyrus ussuriensis x Pyrus communis]
MSNLINSCKAVTTVSRLPPLAHSSAATAPAQMDHMPIGPGVSQAPASSASSVALPISARCGHHHPRTPYTPSISTTNASGDVYVQPGDELAGSLHISNWFFKSPPSSFLPRLPSSLWIPHRM